MATLLKKLRCQSCGQPLAAFKSQTGETKSNFSTDAKGAVVEEYCDSCYRLGSFMEPDLTLDQMLERSIKKMERELGVSEEQAQVMANALIPQLKRWHTGL